MDALRSSALCSPRCAPHPTSCLWVGLHLNPVAATAASPTCCCPRPGSRRQSVGVCSECPMHVTPAVTTWAHAGKETGTACNGTLSGLPSTRVCLTGQREGPSRAHILPPGIPGGTPGLDPSRAPSGALCLWAAPPPRPLQRPHSKSAEPPLEDNLMCLQADSLGHSGQVSVEMRPL